MPRLPPFALDTALSTFAILAEANHIESSAPGILPWICNGCHGVRAMDAGLLSHYGFTRPPFEPVHDTADIFHAACRMQLVQRLTGDVLAGSEILAIRGGRGVGKTSLVRVLASAFRASFYATVQIGARHDPTQVQQLVGAATHDAGSHDLCKTLVLLIDDADAVPSSLFAYVASLVELRRTEDAKTHLVLIGNVGSWRGLDPPDLDRLRRACSACTFLLPFNDDEAASYLEHRLSRAGRPLHEIMTRDAARELVEQSQGVPAQLDGLTAGALMRGYRQGHTRITLQSLRQTVRDEPAIDPIRQTVRRRTTKIAALLSMAAASVATVALLNWQNKAHHEKIFTADTGPEPAAATNAPEAEPAAPAIIVSNAATPAAFAPLDRIQPISVAATEAGETELAPVVQILSSVRVVAKPVVQFLALAARTQAQVVVAAPPLNPPPMVGATVPPMGPGQPEPRLRGPGLVLVAAAGDDLKTLFARVYQGVVPPPYAEVTAANTKPVRAGSLVIFPEPPNGWPRSTQTTRR